MPHPSRNAVNWSSASSASARSSSGPRKRQLSSRATAFLDSTDAGDRSATQDRASPPESVESRNAVALELSCRFLGPLLDLADAELAEDQLTAFLDGWGID